MSNFKENKLQKNSFGSALFLREVTDSNGEVGSDANGSKW